MAEEELRKLLRTYRVGKGEPSTHTSKSTGELVGGWFSGSYYIEKKNTKSFWITYCNAIAKKSIPTLTEKPGQFGPLRVDFDFKSLIELSKNRQYTVEHLQKIVSLYQEEIRRIVKPSEFEEKILWCIVLEKKAPRQEDKYMKDGFHLHFPHFICEGYVQDIYLRDKVTQAMIDQDVWDKKCFITKIGDFIDKDMFNKCWMLYGSMNYKTKKSEPYLYNNSEKLEENKRYGHVFDHNLDEISLDEMFASQMINRRNNTKYYLPELLSVRGHARPISIIDELQAKVKNVIGRRKRNIPARRKTEEVIADLNIIREVLMDCLSLRRAEETYEWIQVGLTLFGIGQGMNEALELWIEFSKRAIDRFTEGECEKRWDSFAPNNRTIGSFIKWAETDNFAVVKEWKETNRNYYIEASFNFTKVPNEYDISRVILQEKKDEFLLADATGSGLWYVFEHQRYKKMEDGINLRRTVIDEVLTMYCDYKQILDKRASDIEYGINKNKDSGHEVDEKATENKTKAKNKQIKCIKIIEHLKTTAFHDKIVKMCKLSMYDPTFSKKRDENKMIFGCENGVLDLDALCFREGTPDDYRTFSCGLEYKVFREDDEEVRRLDDYLKKVYPNEKRRNYFLDFFATCLQGGNENKRMLFMIGGKDGAKSMTISLLELVFGSGDEGYFGKFPREFLVQSTSKNSSSGARPELERVRGKRIMGSQEMGRNEKFNIGAAKEITGNDSIYARGLYNKGGEIKPQFTLIAPTNEIPNADDGDEAFWSRTRMLDHESTFVKPQDLKERPVPETKEEQMKQHLFKADPTFAKELPELAQPLLWRLFERYKIYKNNKCVLIEPDEVIESTKNYKSQQDKYQRFVDEKLIKEKIPEKAIKAKISISQAKTEYSSFLESEYPSYRVKIGISEFRNLLAKKLGIIKDPDTDFYGYNKEKNKFYGYSIRITNDDDDDSENEETSTTDKLSSLIGKR